MAFFKALIKKASIDDGDCNLTVNSSNISTSHQSGSQGANVSSGRGSQGRQSSGRPSSAGRTGGGSAAAPAAQKRGRQRKSDASRGQQPPPMPAAPRPQNQQQLQQQHNAGVGGGDAAFMELLNGSLSSRIPSAHLPTYLQTQLQASAACVYTSAAPPPSAAGGAVAPAPLPDEKWLAELEDKVMTMPSAELRLAATEDIRQRRGHTRLESLNRDASLIAGRTMSEVR